MHLIITGIRGVPASHGGFETFAENLATFLINKGWEVTVYCQESANDFSEISESVWSGVKRIHIPVSGNGAKATVLFDYLSIMHASRQDKSSLILTLGYNTALFNLWLRIKGLTNVINMDGIEWKRDKWRWYERLWLYINERAGCLIGNHLIADHPEIESHLLTRINKNKVSMIPYGAREVSSANVEMVRKLGIKENNYALLIARPEPENSILEIVKAFSSQKRGINLVVLGKYDEGSIYQATVLKNASSEVKFIGAVYEHKVLDSLRFYAKLYIHGHTVGGTNPSLIEALGAGQPVLAHNNKFNRWVAGKGAEYFSTEADLSEKIELILRKPGKVNDMSAASLQRFRSEFTWSKVLVQYEKLLSESYR